MVWTTIPKSQSNWDDEEYLDSRFLVDGFLNTPFLKPGEKFLDWNNVSKQIDNWVKI